MLKKSVLLVFIIFSICLTNITHVFSDETSKSSDGMNNKYYYLELLNGISSMKSLSSQYLSHIYPDKLYIGPDFEQAAFQDANMYMETNMNTDILLIDLKWQLDGDWFLGIYSELEHNHTDIGNNVYQQIKNPLDADVGIMFIHKF